MVKHHILDRHTFYATNYVVQEKMTPPEIHNLLGNTVECESIVVDTDKSVNEA